MKTDARIKCAILGTGNIGSGSMCNVVRNSALLQLAAFFGIAANSEVLARGRELGVWVTDNEIDGLIRSSAFEDIGIVFDATSESSHFSHHEILMGAAKRVVDSGVGLDVAKTMKSDPLPHRKAKT